MDKLVVFVMVCVALHVQAWPVSVGVQPHKRADVGLLGLDNLDYVVAGLTRRPKTQASNLCSQTRSRRTEPSSNQKLRELMCKMEQYGK